MLPRRQPSARPILAALLLGLLVPHTGRAQSPVIQPRVTPNPTTAHRVVVGPARETRVDEGESSNLSVLSLKLIATPNALERESIAHELARLGPAAREALPALREVADLEPIFVRMAVGRAIWRIEGDTAPLVTACEAALDANDPALRGRAASQLGDLGPAAKPAAPRLRSLLAARSPIVRIQTAEALLRITPDDVAPVAVLANELEGPQTGIATQAAFALGQVGPQHRSKARKALERAAAGSREDVRVAADVILAEFGSDPLPEPPAAEPRPAATPKPAPAPEAIVEFVEPDVPRRATPTPDEGIVTANGFERSRLIDPSEFDVRAPQPEPKRDFTLAAGSDGRRLALDDPPERLDLAFDDLPAAQPATEDELPKPAPVPDEAPDSTQRYGQRPISQISLDTSVKNAELAAFAEKRWAESEAVELAYEGHFLHSMGTTRPWMLQTAYWESTGFCHNPLYFENPNSERYGLYHGKWIQPVVEAGRFYGNVLILPYRIGSEPMCECQYVLGHYRPGDCVPCQKQGTLRRSWRGAAYQAAAVVGLVFIVP